MKDTPTKMKEAFLLAAEQFLECEQPNKAVICLQNSREKELVAHLYEKMNQVVYARLYLYRNVACMTHPFFFSQNLIKSRGCVLYIGLKFYPIFQAVILDTTGVVTADIVCNASCMDVY